MKQRKGLKLNGCKPLYFKMKNLISFFRAEEKTFHITVRGLKK
jgi:hypothetical protein